MSRAAIALPPPPPRRWSLFALLGLIAAVIVASFVSLDLRWREFVEPQALDTMGRFALSFFPPQGAPAFLEKTAWATLETFAMSLLGTALAAVFGLVLALPASVAPVGAGRLWRSLARGLLNALRSIPELVWAALLLIAAGLGPFPGTLALAVHTAGVLGRLFAESIENAPPGPRQALRVNGVGGGRVFLYATLPQIWPQVISFTLYRWENNIRAAAVLGVVGAGGLGQMLYYHLGLFHMRETSTVLIAMIGLVALVDALSYAARRLLNR